MRDTECRIKMLVLPDGDCPFEKWYARIRDRDARVRIQIRLTRVEAGNLGDSRSVGEGVNELRIDYGPGYRLYFTEAGATVVLLCGGDKSTQRRDIERAHTMWKEHRDDPKRFQRDFRP